MRKKINWTVLILCFLIVFAIAFIGSLFTSSNTDTAWYNSIKPDITPPNWVFPVVWNILFALIALSLYFVWTNAKNKKQKRNILIAFGINFVLNILWSVLYFGLKNPFASFIEIFFLWASIMLMIYTAHKINKTAGYLLIPYLFWVSFAVILNYFSI